MNRDHRKSIDEYLELMLKKNEVVNLTAIRNRNDAYTLHIEDSLNAIDIVRKYCSGHYGDLGSGCGFPGIAIALELGIHVDLIDSSKKKMKAVDDMVRELGIQHLIDTLPLRAEEAAQDHRNFYNILTSRAMTRLDSLLELSSPLLEIGGHLIAFKEDLDGEELDIAISMQEIVGMNYVESKIYTLDGKERIIYIFEKNLEPEMLLPRRTGKAQKSPLKRKV